MEHLPEVFSSPNHRRSTRPRCLTPQDRLGTDLTARPGPLENPTKLSNIEPNLTATHLFNLLGLSKGLGKGRISQNVPQT